MQNRRKQLIVDRDVQTRIILAVSWPLAAAIAVVALFLGVLCGDLAQQARALGVDVPSVPATVFAIVVLVLACLGFVAYMALRISHRVAGPIFRLNATMQRFQNGERDARVDLRRGDYLHEVAAGLNGLLEWMQQQLPADAKPAERAPEPETAEAR